MPETPAVDETAQYAYVTVTPHWTVKPGKRGPQVPHDWPQRYLDSMQRHNKQWLAAKDAGVSVTTVQRLRDADPAFAHAEESTRHEFIERLEGNLDRIATGDDMPAVTANIVRLKKLDPVGYVEKNLTMSVELTGDIDSDQGKRLLAAMLGTMTPATQQALTPAHAPVEITERPE